MTALLVAGCCGSGPAHHSTKPRSRGAAGTDVVLVYTGHDGPMNSGSGWVYDARRGRVATAFHVVDGYSAVQVQAGPDGWRAAAVVAAAPCEDIALLAIDDTHGLTTLPFGDERTLSRGATVAGLGFDTSRGTAERGTYFGTVREPPVAVGPELRGIDHPPFDGPMAWPR